MAMAATWTDVPFDLIHLLATSPKLGISDLLRFGSVSTLWRSVIFETNLLDRYSPQLEALNVSPHHVPKLMLAEKPTGSDNDGNREFFDLATGRTFQLPLPNATNRRICGSNNGWVVTMGEDMEIHLLNPITGQQIRLPSQLSFDDFGRNHTNEILRSWDDWDEIDMRNNFIVKAIIIGSPSTPGDCMVAAILCVRDGLRIATVRPGIDKLWTVLVCRKLAIADLIQYNDTLYTITWGCKFPELFVWDMKRINDGAVQEMNWIPMCLPIEHWWRGCDAYYLVEVFGELMAVGRYIHYADDDEETYHTSRVCVFKAKVGRWVEVEDIGDCCLVLGGNTSTALFPVPSGFEKNCIYFTDNNVDALSYGGKDMGVYSLKNRNYSPFYRGNLFQSFSPPIWVTLDPDISLISNS